MCGANLLGAVDAWPEAVPATTCRYSSNGVQYYIVETVTNAHDAVCHLRLCSTHDEGWLVGPDLRLYSLDAPKILQVPMKSPDRR
jgi:hypothetical protein